MSTPRKHHLVAQAYQRGFARRSGKSWQVRVLDKTTGKGGIRNVRDALAERDWNTIVDAAGDKSFEVEEWLANYIDGPAAPAFEKLRNDLFPLPERNHVALCRWMSAQLTRGRFQRKNIAEHIVEVNRLMMKMRVAHYTDEHWMERHGMVPSDELKHQLAHNEDYFDIKPTNAHLLEVLLGGVNEIAEYLDIRRWTLVRFDEPCLCTADNPVVHVTGDEDALGYGVMTAEWMYLPVSALHGLVMTHPWSLWPEAIVRGTRELAEKLNWAVVVHPNNIECVLHPGIERYPLPGAARLAQGGRWPYPPDHLSAERPFMTHMRDADDDAR
jgi:hypothetical protein